MPAKFTQQTDQEINPFSGHWSWLWKWAFNESFIRGPGSFPDCVTSLTTIIFNQFDVFCHEDDFTNIILLFFKIKTASGTTSLHRSIVYECSPCEENPSVTMVVAVVLWCNVDICMYASDAELLRVKHKFYQKYDDRSLIVSKSSHLWAEHGQSDRYHERLKSFSVVQSWTHNNR